MIREGQVEEVSWAIHEKKEPASQTGNEQKSIQKEETAHATSQRQEEFWHIPRRENQVNKGERRAGAWSSRTKRNGAPEPGSVQDLQRQCPLATLG